MTYTPLLGTECPIKPKDIDASRHMFNAFDHYETEISAGWLVRFAQKRGQEWEPFTREDIEAFYAPRVDFWFNRLIGDYDKWIIEKDGKYHFTAAFVAKCYASRPVPR